jgi:sn-glycerol 3-phosphate transport system substrate-binding protein
MNVRRLCIAIAATCAFAAAHAHAATEIHWWHSMNGTLGEKAGELAARFNAAQKDYVVLPVFKGSYDESVAAALAAQHGGGAPHIVQVPGAGSAGMLAGRKTVLPAWEVMKQAGEKFNAGDYLPAVASSYTDAQNRMLSLPFNSATAVLYYNKDAFRKAGLDPASPPKTWDELQEVIIKVRDAGLPCGYTSGWQSWVQLENMHAWHNQEFATKSNGHGGHDARLVFNNQLMMRHIAKLSSWMKSELFTYYGRQDQAELKFVRGECGTLTSSSATFADLKRSAKFDFGVAQLPYYEDFKGAPQNTLIRGTSLWVMAGRKPAEYKGVAKFFSFVSSPAVQADWQQSTGYMPITTAAYELSRQQGYYAANPGTDIAIQQLLKHPTRESKGIRLGHFEQIRARIDEELEQVWSQKKTPKQALDDAVAYGNERLHSFEVVHKVGARQK